MNFGDFLPFTFIPLIMGAITSMICYNYMMIVGTKYKDTPYYFTGINEEPISIFREYTNQISDEKIKRKYKIILLWVWLGPVIGGGTMILSIIIYWAIMLLPIF